MGSSTLRNAPARPEASPWLYGPTWDLMFGYGLAYVVSVPLLLAAALALGGGAYPLWISALLALVISTPHYGVTLLRVYESRKERRAYAIFTVWASLALLALFVAGLHSAAIGSILLTVYVTWGIWHFSAQNYGIAVMYLRRSGVKAGRRLKRPLHASFLFSTALAILSIYVVGSELRFAAGSQDTSGTFRVLQIGIPESLRGALYLGGVVGYLGALGVAFARLGGRLPLRRLGPVALLVGTQALWFSVPAIGTLAGTWSSGTTGYAFAAIWISTAHAAQYLWLGTYYAERSGRCPRRGSYWLRCLLAGAAVTCPGLLLAPGLLGGVAIEGSAIVVLVFAVVNLHHFVLDGAIWKLTDGRVARLLIRSESRGRVAPEGFRWARATVFAVGALVVAQQLYGAFAVRLIVQDDTAIEQQRLAAEHLNWLGLDTPDVWLSVGERAEASGDSDYAIAAYRWAIGMYSQAPPLWVVERLVWLLLQESPDDPDSVAEATRLARYVSTMLGEADPEGFRAMAATHAAAGEWKQAIRDAEWAVLLAQAHGHGDRIPELSQQVLAYRNEAALRRP